ncbi:hypothetical protein GLV94_15975 [Virgibacillus halodenitrificans]|nr:hypothetical protein [Virgibacillus halodenitrificans]MYL47148.1 hypothetical protein [Virgibacillus halodenitrificans]
MEENNRNAHKSCEIKLKVVQDVLENCKSVAEEIGVHRDTVINSSK